MKKLLFTVVIGLFCASPSVFAEDSAQGSEAAPKVVLEHNGFTGFEDGFMTLDGDEYDPTDPSAAAALDYMEMIGEIEYIPENPIVKVAANGCARPLYIKAVLSEQRLYIYENCSSTASYTWKISSGLGKRATPAFDTYPSGRFGLITNMSGKYPGGCTINENGKKVRYGNMSYAVYFAANGNYAIHGGCEEELLGTPRSHGCIRVARANAKFLQGLVKEVSNAYGYKAVRIHVVK